MEEAGDTGGEERTYEGDWLACFPSNERSDKLLLVPRKVNLNNLRVLRLLPMFTLEGIKGGRQMK